MMSSTLLNILPETKHVPAAERLLIPKTNAIPLLGSDLARYYSYAHTGQILVYYYFRASALVADPLATMIQDLFPVAISQCLFCAICLPSVGNWDSGTDAGEIIKGSASVAAKVQKSASASAKKRPGPGMKSSSRSAGAVDPSRDGGGNWPSRILVSGLEQYILQKTDFPCSLPSLHSSCLSPSQLYLSWCLPSSLVRLCTRWTSCRIHSFWHFTSHFLAHCPSSTPMALLVLLGMTSQQRGCHSTRLVFGVAPWAH